ncbi:hypothetical protein DL766_005330 [Monosporascus sp. MC13-8B]|uniref:Heterokaryon incompatibility domain-containing protein n=1 Tax=Monosporascus cannonballus TaxID=155416 RepID=A0ABY0GZT2_9PEZI|nr:hypothetical protein DL762_007237 [Monosporascus cannonballus]RYO95314.1 hypothetical protein DL763_003738 [Monosporascus cannonballus]RYP29526.1 hypothetical protein DL766_005330 [Monosporascus sp. MC13-8B]
MSSPENQDEQSDKVQTDDSRIPTKAAIDQPLSPLDQIRTGPPSSGANHLSDHINSMDEEHQSAALPGCNRGPRRVDDPSLCSLPPLKKRKLERLPSPDGSNPEKSGPSAGLLCVECSQLDFSGVLKHIKELRQQKRFSMRSVVVANVGHRFRQTRKTDCPLCLMLFASRTQASTPSMREAEEDYDELRAKSFVSASNLFDCNGPNQDMRATDDSLCLRLRRTTPAWPIAIHVCTSKDISEFRIRFPIEDSSDSKPFVALSYVWGGSSATHRERKDESGRRLVASSLPATISDAITVTRGLGYQYLWIDKFCIDQDNSEVKHDQIKQMGAIYEQAELTIIAAAGIDENHGLPGVGRTPRPSQWIAQFHGADVIWTPDPHYSIRSSKWSTRGWTFQEGLLSRRRLVFTEDQVYFECKAMNCFESIQSPLDDMHIEDKSRMQQRLRAGVFGRNARAPFGHLDRPDLGSSGRVLQYQMAVEDYSARDLRYDADILNAFRGIERDFSRKNTMRGFYGILYPKFESPLGSAYFYHTIAWRHTRSCWGESRAPPRRRPGKEGSGILYFP